MKTFKQITAAAVIATITSIASAGSAPFTMVNGVTTPGIDVNLTVQESSQPGSYDFVISNSSLVGAITGVYFGNGWHSMLNQLAVSTGDAAFNAATLLPDVPGWSGTKESHTVGKTAVRTWLGRRYYDTSVDNLAAGIQPGESHTFSFATDTNIVSLQDIEEAIGSAGFGVAIRMQDLVADEQAAGWGIVEGMQPSLTERSINTELQVEQDGGDNGDNQTTGVPSPTAAIGGLMMLGLLGSRRRR